MTQHRIDSFMEAACNCAVGVGIAMAANSVFIPMVTGHPLPAASNGALALIFTAVSLVRQYILRRLFNGRTIWAAIRGAGTC